MTEHRFTYKEFTREAGNFRKLLGDKAFYTSDSVQDLAITKFGQVFFNMDGTDDELESASNCFYATLNELQMRNSALQLKSILDGLNGHFDDLKKVIEMSTKEPKPRIIKR